MSDFLHEEAPGQSTSGGGWARRFCYSVRLNRAALGAVGGHQDLVPTTVVVVHARERVDNGVEHHEVGPHGHGASERHLVAVLRLGHEPSCVATNDVGRLCHRRGEVEAAAHLLDLAAVIEGAVGQGEVDDGSHGRLPSPLSGNVARRPEWCRPTDASFRPIVGSIIRRDHNWPKETPRWNNPLPNHHDVNLAQSPECFTTFV